MGTGNEKGTEWAVVGGTGELGMVTGVIHKRLHEHNGDGNVFELTITGFYFLQKDQSVRKIVSPNLSPKIDVYHCIFINCGMYEKQPKAQKLESWGGSGGSPKDITEPPKRLQSISISSATVIDSIAFSYTDEAGKEQSAGPWGGAGGTLRTVSDSSVFIFYKQ